MNESGYSWPEAILTLAIMMLIFSTLLPLSFRMLSGLDDKRLEMRAKETLYQGVLLYTNYGSASGLRVEDGVEYSWTAHQHSVCVQYQSSTSLKKVCTK